LNCDITDILTLNRVGVVCNILVFSQQLLFFPPFVCILQFILNRLQILWIGNSIIVLNIFVILILSRVCEQRFEAGVAWGF